MSRAALTNKTKIIITGLAIVLIGGGAIFGLSQDQDPAPQSASRSTVSVNQQKPNSESKDKFNYRGEEGKTALQILKDTAEVEVKQTSFGEQVLKINGTSGDGPKYWLYYVNDKQSEVGAAEYQTKPTDNIEWRLE